MTLSAKEVLNLPIEVVNPNPYQPRQIFDPNGIEELAISIKTYGVLQPVSVRLIDGIKYELVAGERRLRASKMAGLTHIPAIAVSVTDTDSAVLAIIENLQRRDLHFFEEAAGFANLMLDYNFTQEELALRVGKNQSTIANKLRLLKLSESIQAQAVTARLTERHCRALLRLNTEKAQSQILEKVIAKGLNVRKTEELVEHTLTSGTKPATRPRHKPAPFKTYIRDIRILTNSIKEDLEMMESAGMDTNLNVTETENGYSIHITLEYAAVKKTG